MDQQRKNPGDRRSHQPLRRRSGAAHDEVHRAALPARLHISPAEGTGARCARILAAEGSAPRRSDLPILEVRTRMHSYRVTGGSYLSGALR